MQWPSVCRKLTNLKMNTTDNEHYLKNKDDGMIHANFWLLFISCYLLLGTCHLVLATCSVLPVICYRLLATCYSLLIAASNLNFPYDPGLFEACYFLQNIASFRSCNATCSCFIFPLRFLFFLHHQLFS